MAKSGAPTTVPHLLKYSGQAIYGPLCWRGRLAAGLGVSRSTLRLWLNGEFKSGRDLGGELIELVDRERDAHLTRGVELTALKHELVAATKHMRPVDVAA